MAVEEDVFTTSSYSITSLTGTAVTIKLSGSWITKQINGSLGPGVFIVNKTSGDVINATVSYASMSGTTTATITGEGLSPETEYAIPECAGFIFYDNSRLDIPTRIEFTTSSVTPTEDESYLNKRGLTHFWENIDTFKQDKLTAGTGIAISNNVISATGGGEADSVAWGHITGTLANQTDLNTALGAKANTADLATVATSGSYNDLTNKPTIPSLTRRTGTSAPATVGSLVLGGNGTSTLPYAFPTIVGTNDESFWSYIRTTDITNGISEAYLGAYEYDPTESWWSGKKEARLALYSDIPTVGNATLTIQKNGTSAGTFTANATSNKTINITVPTDADDVGALPDTTKYGASISVSVNTTDYRVTTTLKDQDGNTLGTAQVIDLPLESVVVNGSYDSTNKKIVLTLQNGNTIDIPVADLVAGLQSEITSTNMLDADLVDDSTSTNKFVTAAQITKLNGIAAGAEVNVQSDWNVTSTSSDAFIKNKPTIPTKTSDLTNDSGFLTSYTETDPIYSASAAAGITSTDITNWNNKSDFSGSYTDLTNKPTIGNATLTIQKNGTNVQTFTANATSNKTANITVPTKTSDLTNDSGFLDSVAWGDVTGKPTFATVATSGSYNDLTNKPTIPAAVTVDSALSDSSTNPVQNQVITNALDLKANAADVSTALAGKQATLTAGSHISLSGSTISAVDYVHSDDPVSTQSVTQTVTNSMIATGTITADKFATGATLKLTMSTSDIGEGAALAANTLYGVYE